MDIRKVLSSGHGCMCIIDGFKWVNNLQYSSVNDSLNKGHFTKPHTYLCSASEGPQLWCKKFAQAWDPNKYNFNHIFHYVIKLQISVIFKGGPPENFLIFKNMILLCNKHVCAADRESCTPLKNEHFVPPPVLMSDNTTNSLLDDITADKIVTTRAVSCKLLVDTWNWVPERCDVRT